MNFNFSEEQNLLRESISKFVQNDYDFDTRREIISKDPGYNPAHWTQFSELGWLTVPFSESTGGFGGGPIDTMIVMEELGKGLVVEPYLSTVLLAGQFIELGANSSVKEDLLNDIMSGSKLGAFAYQERQSRFNPYNVICQAESKGDGFELNGSKSVVIDGDKADVLIVTARTSGDAIDKQGISLFLVDSKDAAVTIKPLKLMDGSRAAEIEFNQLQLDKNALLGEIGQASDLLEPVLNHAILAVCAEMVGALGVIQSSTVEYAKTRKQFGTAIGSFQALQHRLAEMFMEYEQCKSLLYRAALSLQQSEGGIGEEVAKDIAALKCKLGEAGVHIAQDAVQLHGGMGLTDELHIGHYLKRILMINNQFGNSDYHKQKFLNLIA